MKNLLLYQNQLKITSFPTAENSCKSNFVCYSNISKNWILLDSKTICKSKTYYSTSLKHHEIKKLLLHQNLLLLWNILLLQNLVVALKPHAKSTNLLLLITSNSKTSHYSKPTTRIWNPFAVPKKPLSKHKTLSYSETCKPKTSRNKTSKASPSSYLHQSLHKSTLFALHVLQNHLQIKNLPLLLNTNKNSWHSATKSLKKQNLAALKLTKFLSSLHLFTY